MKCQGIEWREFLRSITSKDRILLINPPIKELRYAWYKWNQPLDLLKLSSYLKTNIGCEVELIDFMLPGLSGRPQMTSSPDDFRTYKGTDFQFRFYGKPIIEFEKLLDGEIKEWNPTRVIITSLTSYWWEGINLINSSIKSILEKPTIYVMGNYPKYEPKHVKYVFSDFYFTNSFDLSETEADFELYFGSRGRILNNGLPLFASLNLNSPELISQVVSLYQKGIKDFVFFEADILKDIDTFTEMLIKLKEVKRKQPEIKFHGICGFYPSRFQPQVLRNMSEAGFIELHLEYDCLNNGDLNSDAYYRFLQMMKDENVTFSSGSLTGFVNFGHTGENFEKVMLHSLQILELLGGFIPKPFTADPDSEDYQRIRSKMKPNELQFLSPHAYPFAEENNMRVEDYQNYLRLSGFLNNKVRGKSFDFFDNSIISNAVKEAFSKERLYNEL